MAQATAVLSLAQEGANAIKETFDKFLEIKKRQDDLFVESQLSGTVPPYIEYLMSEKYPDYGLAQMHKFPQTWKDKIIGGGIISGVMPSEIRKKLRSLITRTWSSWRDKIAKWKKDAPDYQWDTIALALDEDRLPVGYSFEILTALGHGLENNVSNFKKRFNDRKQAVYDSLSEIIIELANGLDNYLKDPNLLTDQERVALAQINFDTKQLRKEAEKAKDQKLTEQGVKNILDLIETKFKVYADKMSEYSKIAEVAIKEAEASKIRSEKVNTILKGYNIKI
jgi:hypothetical protein